MKIKMLSCCFFILFLFSLQIFSQELDEPYCIATHYVGKLELKTRGATAFGGRTQGTFDCYTNKRVILYGAEYPKNSGITSLFTAGIYIGGIIGTDTLMLSNDKNSSVYSKL